MPADHALLRIATEQDAPLLSDFGAKCFRVAFEHLYSKPSLDGFLTETRSAEAYRQAIKQSGANLCICENSDGDILGYVLCGPMQLPIAAEPEALELKHIYVDPSAQSGGYGKKLTEHAIAFAKAQEAPALYLGVYSENFGAQKFYERLGFVKVGAYDFKVGEHIDHEFIFKLDLK